MRETSTTKKYGRTIVPPQFLHMGNVLPGLAQIRKTGLGTDAQIEVRTEDAEVGDVGSTIFVEVVARITGDTGRDAVEIGSELTEVRNGDIQVTIEIRTVDGDIDGVVSVQLNTQSINEQEVRITVHTTATIVAQATINGAAEAGKTGARAGGVRLARVAGAGNHVIGTNPHIGRGNTRNRIAIDIENGDGDGVVAVAQQIAAARSDGGPASVGGVGEGVF